MRQILLNDVSFGVVLNDVFTGHGGVLNSIFGYKNILTHKFDIKIRAIKNWLRDKPGFTYLRAVYRVFKKPFVLLNRAMVKLFI